MFGKEPTLVLKVLEEIIRAAIPVALIFGWVHWTDEQTGTVMLFIGVVAGGVSALWSRSQTVSVGTANKQIEMAVQQPVGTSVQRVVEMTKEAEDVQNQ